jgi:REP element-mobilizing transposase RayT
MTAELYKEKYRVATTRLPNWDYSNDGFYFITICEYAMREYFGAVKNDKMMLTPIGEIADKCWREIPDHFPFVTLDEFVVMPNHVHGLVQIVGARHDAGADVNVDAGGNDVVANRNVGVETQNLASLQSNETPSCVKPLNKFGPQSRNLASIIRGYKIGVTKWARNNFTEFKWQSRFYDTVIRDQKSLDNIRQYIRTNPERWHRDRNNIQNEFKYCD